MNSKLATFARVVEIEMSFPFMVYFLSIGMGVMFEFLCIFGALLIVLTFLMSMAHFNEEKFGKLRKPLKFVNVGLTVLAFMNIFLTS